MGVADNKTYKDQYHFNDKWFRVKGEDYPSINDEDKINSTIKENPYRSNVEIEGKEVVLQPDLSALFKAVGKRHSKGGMDVLLKPDSFIFSDDKTLALDEKDHKLFEFKEGGNFRPDKNTPAAVLKRNVDVKHYNTLVNNINEPTKDDLAKKSSLLMLEKYIQTLGNIAYVQEEKKGFPQGLPAISEGTAPVYDPNLKQDIMENKQYRKYGGVVDNPEMQQGGTLPHGRKLNDTRGWKKVWENDAYIQYENGQLVPKKGNMMTNQQWLNYLKNETPEQKARRKEREGQQKIINYGYTEKPIPGERRLFPYSGGPTVNANPLTDNPFISTGEQENEKLTPNPVTDGGEGYKDINWQFTPWQKISQAYGWGNYANVKRYMPYRSRYNATYAEPALLNEQQSVGNVRAAANQQLDALNTLNPVLRNAQASSIYGQLLDQIPQIGLSVENQNVGIKNQFRSMNNQIKNQETLQNMQNDQQYYQQSIIGRQNFDNLRNFAANQAMNNVMRDVETNQKLAYNELTQNNPAYSFDFRTGNFRRNPKNILDVQGRTSEDTWQAMVREAERLSKMGVDKSVISALVRGKFFQQAAPYFQQAPTPPPFSYRRGGRIK